MIPRATRSAALLVVAVLLAGCGTAAPSPTTAPAQPTAAAATPAPTKPAAATSPAAATKPAAAQPTAAPKVGGKIRLGMSVAQTFEFLPGYVGADFGIYQKHGLDVEVTTFGGDSPMQQAIAANSLDLALGSATGSSGAISKGVPSLMIGEISATPRFMVVIGSTKQGINTLDDLKGKRVGVTSSGAFTDLVVRKLNQSKGWTGSDAAIPTPLGAPENQMAAIKRGEIAGQIDTADGGYRAEESGDGKILASATDFMPNLTFEVLLGRKQFIQDNPALTQEYVNAFYETVDAMRKDKAKTVELMGKYMNLSKSVAEKVYDLDMQTFSKDGTWHQEALNNALQALVEIGVVDKAPSVDSVMTTKFVPAKF